MAHRVLGVGLHLAERDIMADGLEDRIVSEAVVPAWRPGDQSVNPSFETFDMSVRPAERKRADEMGIMSGVRPGRGHAIMNQAHGEREVLTLTSPAR